jgi:hypothetical protein
MIRVGVSVSVWRGLLLSAVVISAGEAAVAQQAYFLSFSGTIDGSDTVTITGNQATWQHTCWANPTRVTLNGMPWQPQTYPTLTSGAPLIPSSLSGYAVRVNRISGRDVATAEIQGNGLVMNLDDTPNGSNLYQYKDSSACKTGARARQWAQWKHGGQSNRTEPWG